MYKIKVLCTPKNKNKCVAYLNVCRYKLIANSELFVTFRLRVFHSNITISTLNTASQGSRYQIQWGGCVAVQTSSGRARLWSHLLPSSLPSWKGERSLLNEPQGPEWEGGGGLIVAQIKGVQESHTHSTQTHACAHLTTSGPSCPVLSLHKTRCPVLSPGNQKQLLSSFLPLGQPAPPREIPEQCWNTLLSTHSQNDCWVIPVYSYVLPPVCKHYSLYHPCSTAIKIQCP